MQGAQVFLDEDEGLNDEIMFRHLVPGECFSYFYYLLTFIIGNNDDEQQQDRRRKGPNGETVSPFGPRLETRLRRVSSPK